MFRPQGETLSSLHGVEASIGENPVSDGVCVRMA